LVIATSHTTMHGSMNVKKKNLLKWWNMYDVNVCCYFNQISTYNREQSYTIGSYRLLLAQNNTWETANVEAFCMGFGNILMYNFTLEYICWLKTINFSVKLSNFYFIFYMLSLMMIQSGWNMYMEYTTYSLTQSFLLICPLSKYLKKNDVSETSSASSEPYNVE